MINLLEYKIFSSSKNVLLELIRSTEKLHIISGNPEVLSNGLKFKELYDNFNDEHSVIIPDGVGTVLAAKLIGTPVKEKIAGIEVMDEIIKYANEKKLPLYLLGTKQEILVECVKNLKDRYSDLNICGYHDGFFDLDNCNKIVSDIQDKKPFILFVAMGSPRQEKFIAKYMDKLPCTIFMGVGGSFDIIAGKMKRAPKWMIKCGLEWLYRVIKEPFRIKRLFVIPKFILKVIAHKKKMKNKVEVM